MNVFPNNSLCPRPIAKPVAPDPPRHRRDLDGLQEGDPIYVQTPSGICEQGVYLRIEDGFLIWIRSFSGTSYITITSLDAISITRV